MKKFIRENKLVSVVVAFLFTSFITYAVTFSTWITGQLYSQREKITTHVAVQVVEDKQVSKQIKEVKEELSSFKKEIKEEGVQLRKDIVDNQKELLKILIDIKKNGKK